MSYPITTATRGYVAIKGSAIAVWCYQYKTKHGKPVWRLHV